MTQTEFVERIRLLTTKQVCDALGIAERTLKKWTAKGQFPPGIRLQSDGGLKWRASDVEAFIEKRKRQRLGHSPRGFKKSGGEE